MSAREGYDGLSIAVHWVGAALVIALFVTHEGAAGTPAWTFHVAGGNVIALFLVWRVARRARRGFAAKPDQGAVLNAIARATAWGILACLLALSVTGWLLPWANGAPLNLATLLAVPSPLPPTPGLYAVLDAVHAFAGHAIVPLVVLHLAGAAKHAFLDGDGVLMRMVTAVRGGH